MFFTYLGEVLKRAFTPTARVTDVLQILAASTLPALGKFAGVSLPSSAGEDALAYIGLIAISYIAIRLLWAPYAIWKDDKQEIGGLKLELSKPERLVLEHLAKLRAKNRLKIVKQLDIIYAAGFRVDGLDPQAQIHSANVAMLKAKKLAHKAGLPADFNDAVVVLHGMSIKGVQANNLSNLNLLNHILEYLNDRVTIEFLSHQSRTYIAEGKPQ